ncbi:hypothetical protein [Saccharothrix texasensis]|uniref:Uncharacterized protein n=1 Tax=Saccharothrix texasensis TaxID=103734 RepID=A0A3N1H153_9PSEU|nr:hypothetical protein [Saccharothrix texasensis]ROP36261.1 hypothetical protein EDD40_1526 [Saccharothrix texasensis]
MIAVAECVISETIGDNGPVQACVVHTHIAPCPRNGRAASRSPLHTDTVSDRDAILVFWDTVTARQRPLVIHRGSLGDPRPHSTGVDDFACWCEPEVLAAKAGDRRG